jgi:protein ImuB
MTVSQVSAMCPDARCFEHDPHADIEGLIGLSEQLQQFSPIVGIESLDPKLWSGRSLHQPQSILMDATGLASWFGGEKELGQAVQSWMSERHLLCCVGIAGTVGEAWAISNYAYRNRIAEAMLQQETGGVTTQQASDAPSWVGVRDAQMPAEKWFSSYPIEALRLEIEWVAKLHRLGIRTIESLLQLPRSSLTSRFGTLLLERIDQCIHGKDEAIRAHHQGESPEGEIELEHPLFRLDDLTVVVEQVTRRLCQVLERQGSGALRILCRIALERQTLSVEETHDPTHSRAIAHVMQLSLFAASRDPAHITWLLLGQLERSPPRVGMELGVRSVRMEATVTAPLQWQQNELFDANQPRYRQEVAKLIDALSARLGRQQVVSPSIVRDPMPEWQVKMRSLTGIRKDGRIQDTKRKLAKSPKRDFAEERTLEVRPDAFLSRPTSLLAQPLPIELVRDPDGAIASIVYRGVSCKVEDSVGPERIESGWWSGPTHRRDYFRIILETGDWWWIYRDLRSGVWYLHGAMD